MSIIEYCGVTRKFAKKEVLHGVDLKIDEACIYGLVGRNGAGKSTLLKMIPCLLHTTAGKLSVFDKDPWDFQDELKQRVGYLADEDNYPFTLRIGDVLKYSRAVYKKWDRQLERDMLQKFALEEDSKIVTLSKGQKRQFSLLTTMCFHPELLILDEPAAGLDPVIRHEFLQVILERLGDEGITVIFSSHQFADVERLAGRVGILHEGILIEDAPLNYYHNNYCKVIGNITKLTQDKLRTDKAFVSLKDNCGLQQLSLKMSFKEVEVWAGQYEDLSLMDCQPLGLEELFIELTSN